MGINYSGTKASVARYTCDAANVRHGDPKCLSFSAVDVDPHVARQLLTVLQPGALEAARQAWAEEAGARDRALEALELQAAQARYQALRAERQYDAVDPDNRTVASELERRWNAALDVKRSLEHRLTDARARRDVSDNPPPDSQRFLPLAHDLERVWASDKTDMVLKKRIVRTVVEQIWGDVDDTRQEIVLVVHWKGGAHTELRVRKRRSGERGNKTAPDVVEAVRLLSRILRDHEIAAWLGRAGMRTPTGHHYTRALVASVRHLRGIEAYSEARRRAEGWLTCDEVATLLHVDAKTVRRAVTRGELPATRPLPEGPLIFARSDVVGTTAALRVTTRADDRRSNRGAGPSPHQLSLEIPST
jgi:excisionase family DNA binding protein